MKKLIPLLAFAFLLFFMPSVKAIDISGCSVLLSNSKYTLTADIIDADPGPGYACFRLGTGGNISLDCQNHLVDGKDLVNRYGILLDENNIQISNCRFTDWYYGIWAPSIGSENDTITNVTTSSNLGGGIWLSTGNNITIENLTLDDGFVAFNMNNLKVISSDITGGVFIQSTNLNLTNVDIINGYLSIDLNNVFLRNVQIKNNIAGGGFGGFDVNILNAINCENTFENVTSVTSEGDIKYIVFYNMPVTIDGWTNVSEIVLCNADNSTIKNININSTGRTGGIFMAANETNNYIIKGIGSTKIR
jgi:hypothetical protein